MPSPLTAETLWRLPRVGAPVIAGEDVIVPVTTYDPDDGKGRSRLWRVPVAGGEPRPLTAADTDTTKPVPSPDGRRLAFLREHEGRKQLHVMPLDGGEPERVSDFPLGARGAVWMPDGKSLVAVAELYAGHLIPEETEAERDRREESESRHHVTESAVYRYWDMWLTGGEVPHLFLLDLAGGLRDLTPESTRWMRWPNVFDPVADVAVSPDGAEVAYVADRSEPPHRDLRMALFTVDVASGKEDCLTLDLDGHVQRPRYTEDGSSLVYGVQFDPEFYADRVRLVVRDRNGDGARVLTEDWDRSAQEWDLAGDHIVFAAEEAGRQPLWRVPLAGGTLERIARDGTLGSPAVTPSGRIVANHSSLLSPNEIVRVEDGRIVRLTSFTSAVVDEIDLPRVEEITVMGAEDDEIQVYLVVPPGDRPFPLVHMIHGGPHGIFGDTWHWRWNAAAFSAPGYLVALVNFHGSTSWGQEFAERIAGAWGDMPARDIEAATDALIERGVADPDRMAITGGSYGGYLVAWLTAQTTRYACAIAHAAVADLPGMYASDITMGRARSYGAEIWEDLDRINRWSPVAHSAGYETPTLVIHGGRDQRVPVTQGLALYGILKAKGVEARLVHYPDENHWILARANSIHWYGEVLSWLERFLAGG